MPKRRKRKPRRSNAGLSPGSLVFTGEKRVAQSNVTLLQYNETEILETHLKDEIPKPTEGNWVNWYDIRGLHNIPLIEKLGMQYDIHPLILEDVLDTNQRPKFEEYDNGLFLIVEALTFDVQSTEIQTEQVAVFFGEGVVISFQEKEDDLFLPVRERLHSGKGRIRKRLSDYLAYALADTVTDKYYFILDQIEEELDKLEAQILYAPNHQIKSLIHELKLSSLTLRKTVSPLREAINRFSKSEHPVIKDQTDLFVRDLYDHTVQVMDMIETYRDIINGLYDLYLSEISFKMNSVMQMLTIVSTIFIPLTFLAGIYGMNFEHMPELHWRYGYFIMLAFMAALSILLIYYFKRKKWM